MSKILDGKKLSEKIKEDIKNQVNSEEKTPTLAAILVGEDPASKTYLKLKDKDCTQVGIDFKNYHLEANSTIEKVTSLINDLNEDEEIDGIIVQLPLPDHLDRYNFMESINPGKDVDGLTHYNIGKLWSGDYNFEKSLIPCTPKGIIRLLDDYEIDLEGRKAVIINRSDLVGKPLAKLLLDRNATVTVCHSRTENLEKQAREADILISAVGARPNFVITRDMVKEGAVVIDVGMNHMDDGLYGDVKFDEVKKKTSYITPVPGGVGPMTRVMLLENIMIAGGMKS